MKNDHKKDIAVLIVDDTPAELLLISSQLEERGYRILRAENGKEAIRILNSSHIDLIMSDYMMPQMNGIELLTRVKKKYDIPFVMITSYGNIDDAVLAVRMGAEDYIVRPCSGDEICLRIEKVLEYTRVFRENREYRAHQHHLCNFDNIITRSEEMYKAIYLASKVAKSPATTVAIFGESGTGKELLARAIHCESGCPQSRFVGLNCAGIPSGLLESELFGHVKGAFTGADKDREGKFASAQNGTLLLDEIGDMPLELQAKLLRVIQEREYEKVGSDKKIPTNARIIVTTHRNIEQMVREEKFREDLFHRINTFPIFLPPLRERKDDIPLLAEYYMNRFRRELGKSVPGISEESVKFLSEYHWPGNVRELKNCIERAMILSDGDMIRPHHLSLIRSYRETHEKNSFGQEKTRICLEFDSEEFSLDAVIRQALNICLEKCGNNKAQAAKLLKIDRNMFYRRTAASKISA